jgi:nucleoporin NUP82
VERNNHWSFDRPTLAIDLKKLVDGTSLDEDFAPSGFGQNKGFSADSVDMEVASACFGGHGYDEEDAWASMTLWIAMRPGDVYALCPLLPGKWKAPPVTIPSLTTSIVLKLAAIGDDSSEPDDERRPTTV